MDVDKLDAIGAFGIFRCAAFSGSRNIPLYLHEDDDMYQKCAIGHFDDKLLRLEGMMMTKVAQKVAIQQTAMMKEFVEKIKQEEQLLDFRI
jgi:uncharacterized protein